MCIATGQVSQAKNGQSLWAVCYNNSSKTKGVPKLATTKTIPTMHELPLIGSSFAFLRDILGFRLRVAAERPGAAMYNVGPYKVVSFSSPELVHEVLVDKASQFERLNSFRWLTEPLLGNGILTIDNAGHRPERRLVQPAFNHKRVGSYADIMATIVEDRVVAWQPGSVIDVRQEMLNLTMSIIGKVLFDLDLRAQVGGISEAISIALTYATNAMLLPIPLSVPTPGNRRVLRAIDQLNTTIASIIAERRASGEDRGDILSMLLASRGEDGEQMTDRQLRDEVMTLFIAGHETTASALAWSFYLLGQYPGYQARLQQEATSTLAGRTPTLADLPALPFAQQVFKETIRLYPPVHVLPRNANTEVEVGGYYIPPGAIVVLDTYAMQRSASYFPQPLQFNPDRFSAENERTIPKGAYLPFGLGPRGCIGQQFAMLEAHMVLVAVSQRVELRLLPGQRVQPQALLSLRPSRAIRMRVER